MPWDMHRLTVAEWQQIVEAGEKQSDGEAGPPDGWEHVPFEEVTGDG